MSRTTVLLFFSDSEYIRQYAIDIVFNFTRLVSV